MIKLDESEIVKGQKMERVSITLMNRALDPGVTPKDPKYFSVQSKMIYGGLLHLKWQKKIMLSLRPSST